MTALLLLAGCLGTEDAEEDDDDVLEILGCGDETSVTYNANATNISDDLCVYEDVLENTIVDFINLMENGPDMANMSSPVGYSVELSEIYADMEACMEWEYWNPDLVDESQPYNGCPEDVEEVTIHYMETVVMTSTGYKSTMEHTIGEETEMGEIIMEGNEMQYFFKNSTEDFTIRMKHSGTFEDALEGMMSDEDPLADMFGEGMGFEEDDMGGGVEGMVCYDQETSTTYYLYTEDECDEEGNFWVPEEYSVAELAEFGEFDAGNFTLYYEPAYAVITGFAPDETGYTFSGINKLDFTPFSYFEIHTDSDFNVLGFTLEDTQKEDSWVEFMMISSGETSTDETIPLSALPYVLVDLSQMSDDDGGDSDDIDWMVYYDGYCEWEGNPDDNERWSCKLDQSDSDWENWWYYCELHEGDWYCTDDFGQSSDYANSADNDRYFNGYDEDSDDDYVEEVFHYYDNCEGDVGDFECWMDEWDHDGDGDYEESNGYGDCFELGNGTWECFAGYADDDEEEGGTFYYCTPFVAHNSAGFSIFDNSSLSYSMCGMEASNETYEFDDSPFTMPTHLTWENCWLEDNETVCEQGEIYYDVNTTMLWETTHENNYMDCDGDYDNNTSMCTEWIGNITDSDGNAFIVEDEDESSLMMYQYDEANQSGLVITIQSDDNQMDPEMMFDLLDMNDDGEVTASEWSDSSNETDEPMDEGGFEFITAMMDNYDEDDSGGLDFDEFMTFWEEMQNMEDIDEDDMIMLMAFSVFTFLGADADDYTIELAMCSDALSADMECGDSVYSVPLSSIMASSEEESGMMLFMNSIVLLDSDGSGTLTTGDYLMINNATLDVDGEWNTARLYSTEADAYSDENPMAALPGFTGFIATIGLLGAALIRRE